MGGAFQSMEMLEVAWAILAGLLLAAFLVTLFFESRKTRKRILLGTIAVYLLGFVGFFGWAAFILFGNLN